MRIGIVTRPTPYVLWAAIVLVALYATYFVDPYVFAFTTLGLAWLTAAVGLVGLAACLSSRRLRASGRFAIVVALVVTAAAIAKALATLRGFNWA